MNESLIKFLPFESLINTVKIRSGKEVDRYTVLELIPSAFQEIGYCGERTAIMSRVSDYMVEVPENCQALLAAGILKRSHKTVKGDFSIFTGKSQYVPDTHEYTDPNFRKIGDTFEFRLNNIELQDYQSFLNYSVLVEEETNKYFLKFDVNDIDICVEYFFIYRDDNGFYMIPEQLYDYLIQYIIFTLVTIDFYQNLTTGDKVKFAEGMKDDAKAKARAIRYNRNLFDNVARQQVTFNRSGFSGRR